MSMAGVKVRALMLLAKPIVSLPVVLAGRGDLHVLKTRIDEKTAMLAITERLVFMAGSRFANIEKQY
jgi:hypothetical protein